MPLFTKNKWKIYASGLILLTLAISLSGCATVVAKIPPTVLLQEDKIYEIPAGQEITVELNSKPQKLTFPYPMVVMSIDNAIKIEQEKNNAMFNKVKADKDNAKKLGIVGSILTILGIILGAIFRKKIWPTISAKVDMK
jgi:hypothetical protein